MAGPDIRSLLEGYPEFLRGRDLIRLGLFGSKFSIQNAKRKGNAPPSVKLGFNRVFFPKEMLIQWLEERHRKNTETDDDSTK